MQKVLKFAGVTVGAGAVIGFSVVGWLYAHRLDAADAAVQSSNATALTSPTSVGSGGFSGLATPTPGLSVVSNGNQGLAEAESSSGAATTTPTPTPNPNVLPGPSGFGVYDQYKTASSALYIDVQAGTGAAVAQNSSVTVQYRAYLTNGTEFDDTYATGKPFTFTEGGNVIAGFSQGLFGMKVGGERRLIIPPSVGYGATAQGTIPANSVLVFDVVLVSVN